MSYQGQPPFEPPPGYGQAPQWGQQPPPGYQQALPQWGPGPQFQPPPKRGRWPRRHPIITGLGGAVVLFAVIGIAAGASSPTTPASSSQGSQAQVPVAATTTPPAPAPAATTAPPAPSYTVPEQQAIDSAEQYLSMGDGFSRKGLIQQLDSPDGEGFSRTLAVFAVNHVHVNWYHQAVLSAKGYLQMGGFSYASLVQQLDSSAGEQFTVAQAQYAAKKVGL